MHFRKLLVLLSVLSMLFSARAALALGLGEITLRSSLNQPLDVEISLIDIGNLSAEQIIVKLASAEDFERVGLERLFFYSKMKFEVITASSHGPYIRLTTRESVVEPFLSFIVEARWSSGRLLHEYTVLLDLPAFSSKAPLAIQGTVATPQGLPSGKTEPVRQQASRPQTAVSGNRTGGRVEGEILVGQNDTLWEIALKVRHGGASVYQTMMALQRANPHAFINNNINLLRAGQVLRIPTVSEIETVNLRQAQSSVAQQNNQWTNNTMAAELDASGRGSSVSRTSGDVSGRVKLAASGGAGSAGNGSGLEQELAIVAEELARSQSENDELRDRALDLEEQIETMESLLEVSSAQMRALELAAENSNAVEDSISDAIDAVDSTVDDSIADVLSGIDDIAVDATDALDDAADDVSSIFDTEENDAGLENEAATTEFVMDDEPDEVVEDIVEVEATPAPVVRTPPAPSLMDKAMDYIGWIIGGIVILLIAGVMLMRKSGGDGLDDDFIDDYDTGEELEVVGEELSADSSDEFDALDDDLGDDLDAPIDDTPIEAETGDVVTEADIYISLEQYDQAEGMLQKGLADEPNSLPIQLKLMEVFVATKSLQSFDGLYSNILQSDDADGILRAQGLRAQFADAPEFNANVSVADNSFEELDLDLDLDADDLNSDEGLNLDLNLDESLDLDLDESLNLDDADLSLDESLDLDVSLDAEDTELSLDAAVDDLVIEGLDDLDLDDLDLDLGDTLGETVESVETAAEELTLELDAGDDALESVSETVADVASELDEAVDAIELTDDGSDDFDLDTAMGGDLDLDALDKEMADLDFDSVLDSDPETDSTSEASVDIEMPALGDDDVFDAALSDVNDAVESAGLDVDDLPTPEEAAAASEDDIEDDLDFLADSDEAATKLDLARAYVDMGDAEGAKDILSEVLQEGNEAQRADAEALLERINS